MVEVVASRIGELLLAGSSTIGTNVRCHVWWVAPHLAEENSSAGRKANVTGVTSHTLPHHRAPGDSIRAELEQSSAVAPPSRFSKCPCSQVPTPSVITAH